MTYCWLVKDLWSEMGCIWLTRIFIIHTIGFNLRSINMLCKYSNLKGSGLRRLFWTLQSLFLDYENIWWQLTPLENSQLKIFDNSDIIDPRRANCYLFDITFQLFGQFIMKIGNLKIFCLFAFLCTEPLRGH